MTLPRERTRAVLGMAAAVADLGLYARKKSDRVVVPRELLLRAVQCLRHYPTNFDLLIASQHDPDMWGMPE